MYKEKDVILTIEGIDHKVCVQYEVSTKTTAVDILCVMPYPSDPDSLRICPDISGFLHDDILGIIADDLSLMHQDEITDLSESECVAMTWGAE